MKKLGLSLLVGVAAMTSWQGCQTTANPPAETPVALFNGQDLVGWKPVLADPSVKPETVWSVKDGILACTGTPVGFIYAGKDYVNFRLVVEYRWPPGSKPGNSGIFSRITDGSKALPRCVETQLQHGNAGDVLGLQGMNVSTNQPRSFVVLKHKLAGDIFGVRKLVDAENPAGEWNRVEIQAQGPNYTVWVNGTKVNEVTGVETVAGPVGLQSEGGAIEFRRAALTPLP